MLQKIFKNIIILLIISAVTSCALGKPRMKRLEPSKFFKKDLENASPDFKQGWADGCESGMAGGSNSFNQSFYKANTQDGYKFTYSPDYKTAWGNAFWFCYRTDFVTQKSTPTSSIFRGMP
jgi:hypothetical protein